jgi:hypothetical protein
MDWVKGQINEAMADHIEARHKTVRSTRWQAPTLLEIQEYVAKNPELKVLDIEDIYKGYSDSGWIDTQGKPIRNWKLKFRTLANMKRERTPESNQAATGLCACGCGRTGRVVIESRSWHVKECYLVRKPR